MSSWQCSSHLKVSVSVSEAQQEGLYLQKPIVQPQLNTMILSRDRKRVTAKPTPTLSPKPGKHKRANKDAKIYVGWSATVLIHYILLTSPKRFYWLAPQSVVNNYCGLCTGKDKQANKNIQQRTLSSFVTISFYKLCFWWVFRRRTLKTTEKTFKKLCRVEYGMRDAKENIKP